MEIAEVKKRQRVVQDVTIPKSEMETDINNFISMVAKK